MILSGYARPQQASDNVLTPDYERFGRRGRGLLETYASHEQRMDE